MHKFLLTFSSTISELHFYGLYFFYKCAILLANVLHDHFTHRGLTNMKTRSLQSKLFIAYLGMACLILFSFAIFFYVFASGQLKKSQISAMSTLNSTFQSQVDSAIQNLDTVSVNINYSNMSKSVLDQKFDLNISDEMLSAMSDLFISLSGTELKADQVNLYDFSGYVLQAGLSTMVKKATTLIMNGSRKPVKPTEKKS